MSFVKKSLTLLFAGLLILTFACSDDDGPTEPQNEAPAVPVINAAEGAPGHNSVNQSVTPTLCWNCTDPDGDAISYDVYFGTSDTPPKVSEDQAESRYSPGTLAYGTKYFWQVVANDGAGHTATSPVWDFTTVAQQPVLVTAPDTLAFGANLESIDFYISNSGTGTLTWTISDNFSWLGSAVNSGTTADEQDTVAVLISRDGMNPGTYYGHIIITSDGGTDTIFVVMDVVYEDVIMPMKVGNWWTFEEFYENGYVDFYDTSSLEITGKGTVNYEGTDYEVYFWQWFFDGFVYEYKNLFRNESDGLWNMGYIDETDPPDIDTVLNRTLMLKYPVTVGERWTIYDISATYDFECLAVDEQLVTPAGTFNCIVYQQIISTKSNGGGFASVWGMAPRNAPNKDADEVEYLLYFAPGTGYIAFTVKDNGTVTNSRTLIDYHVQ